MNAVRKRDFWQAVQWRRPWASAASVVVAVLLLSPVCENGAADPRDDFPLSYYPMFTKPRGRTTRLIHVVAVTADGRTINVPSRFSGPGGMNTQRRQMRKAVRGGQAQRLARRVADRLTVSRWARRHRVETVQVVESRFLVQAYFTGRSTPVARQVYASARLGPVVRRRLGTRGRS